MCVFKMCIMKRVSLFILCMCGFCAMSFAQLSTRENVPGVIRTGTRPQAKDFGIFIGPSISEIKDIVDKDIKWKGMPLVNFKYYFKDKLEGRIGLQFSKTRENSDGDLLTGGSTKAVDMNSYNRITPGIAYHFSSKNVVDVYVGANLPIGWDRYKSVRNTGNDKNEVSQNVFVMGLGGFIGLQWFVADLPVAIGLEYGFYGLSQSGMKYKHVIKQEGITQIYYTNDLKEGSPEYDNLKRNKFDLGTDLRVTLSYYFKK